MAQLTPLLKEVYEGSLNDQLNDETTAYTRLKSSGKGVKENEFGGKYVQFAIHTGRNQGIGARNENEALPDSGRQKTASAQTGLRYQYAGIEITGQVFALATKKYQAFADAVDLEINRIKEDLSKDRNRQFFGNGNGRIATITAVAGQNLTLDSLQFIQDDMILDVVLPSNGTLRGAGKAVITAVNETTRVITVSGVITGAVAGDILVRAGSYGREWTGLDAIISDTSTLYGINPATERVWKSHVIAHNAAINEAVLKRMADRIKRAGGKTTVMWTTPGVERAYWQLLAGSRRFVNPKEYTGGYSGVEFMAGNAGSIPMITDVDAPAGQAIFLNENEVKIYRDKEFQFMDRDGSMWTRKINASGRYDSYLADLYEYSELGTSRRNTHGKVTGITEDAD
jgi:hypothetical protein